MARSGHFAILITIDRYPGLSDLKGPGHDGQAYVDWLQSSTGGDVDPKNITHIKSSEFGVMNDAYEANPTERKLIHELDKWLRFDGGWREWVGERLYMYFAGHGFTAGSSISDPALFSAVAQNGDPAHIAGYRYASKIANAGFFDEIVLVMDCCQDVLKASQVLEPTWSPPDRNKSANVRLLQAYGAPRGRKAFERVLAPGVATRGLFSSVWIEALETAEPDADGWVTGQAVKTRVRQLWNDRFKQEAGYDPPVRTPDGDDIRFFSRQPGSEAGDGPKIRIQEVDDLVESPVSPLWVNRPSNVPFGSDPGVTGRGSIDEYLVSGPVGLGRGHAQSIAPDPGATPAPVQFELSARERGTEIIVFDAALKKVGSTFGHMAKMLPPGTYKAQFKTANAMSETIFRLEERPVARHMPRVKFDSAAPVIDTSSTHEYQRIPAEILAVGPVDRGLKAYEAQILILARDSKYEPGAQMQSPLPWQGLRLESLQDSTTIELFDPSEPSLQTQTANGFGACKLGVLEGSYVLTQEEGLQQLGFAIFAARGWRTEVYVDCLQHTEEECGSTSARLDWSTASVHLVRMDEISLLSQDLGRETEIARQRLATGRQVGPLSGLDGEKSPMLALFTAYSALGNGIDAVKDVRHCLNQAPKDLLETFPDFVLLDRWCSLKEGNSLAHPLPLLSMPMLAQGWQLSASLPMLARLNDQFGVAIGQWRVGGTMWTYWRQPRAIAQDSQNMLRREWVLKRGGRWNYVAEALPRGLESELQRRGAALRPPWGAQSWAPVAKGLREPDPMQSPFQQALRRSILDALEDGWVDAQNPHAIGAQFGLQPFDVEQAYEQLFRAAQEKANLATNPRADA